MDKPSCSRQHQYALSDEDKRGVHGRSIRAREGTNHEARRAYDPNASASGPGATEAVSDPFRVFEIMVTHKMPNCTSAQIRQFVRISEMCLSTEDETSKQEVWETLGGNSGAELLNNMFGDSKEVVLEKTSYKTQRSFVQDVLPIVRLAVSSLVLNATLQNFVNGFLHALAKCLNLRLLQPLLEQIHAEASASPNSAWSDQMLLDIVHTFVVFMLELIRRFDNDFLDDLNTLLQSFVQLGKLLPIESFEEETQHQLRLSFLELTNSVAQKTGQAKLGNELTDRLERVAQRTKDKSRNSATAAYAELPGQLRCGGPRHDNDHADIQNISTLPTAQEILCDLPPYLPPNKPGTVDHLPVGSIEAHRDLHFRLFRHNIVADIRAAIVTFHECGGIQGLGRRGNKQRINAANVPHVQDVLTDIYRHVSVEQIVATQSYGASYIISIDNLGRLRQTDFASRCAYWEKSRRLQHGSLACLYWESGLNRQVTILFGVISERETKHLSKNRPNFGFKCIPEPFNETLLALMEDPGPDEWRSEILLLQAGPSFFAYHPVLEALKNAPIPLSEYITQPPTHQGAIQQSVPAPAYTREGGSYHLSFLCSEETLVPKELQNVSANELDAFPIDEIVASTTLTHSQAEALKIALFHELAIIQGPPGTGKTYLGIQIVKALLTLSHSQQGPNEYQGFQRRSDTFAPLPILCVCYTNHALDQFLSGILESGVTNIVRVGGNGTCEKLEEYNLRKLKKPGLGRRGYELNRHILPDFRRKICTYSYIIQGEWERVEWEEIEDFITKICPHFQASLQSYVNHNKHHGTEESPMNLQKAWRAWCQPFSDAYYFMYPLPRSLDVLFKLHNFWNITSMEHQHLKNHWRNVYLVDKGEKIKDLMTIYEAELEHYHGLQRSSDLSCLKKAFVVGMTTTFVAKNQQLLAQLKPQIVIVEEAAEVLEAHVLASLSSETKHLILVGDHLQLRPKVEQYILQTSSRSGFDLDISLFERLITQNNLPFATLQTQRRMRPQFSRLIRSTVYPDLKDHESVTKYPDCVPGMTHTMFFYDHDHEEENVEEGRSHCNDYEAHFAVELAAYLVKQQCFEEKDIAVVTPYVGQLLLIMHMVAQTSIPYFIDPKDEEILQTHVENQNEQTAENPNASKPVDDQANSNGKDLKNCMRLATIDNFQGEEAKIVILSLVRNNKEGHIGFLGEKNRINVLLSRAKEGMYILGNSQSLVNCRRSTMWKEVIEMMKEQNCIGDYIQIQCQNHPEEKNKISHWKDFQEFALRGGCKLPCLKQLPCGHICRKQCHTVDRNHVHNDCEVLVTVELPCGHFKTGIPCHEFAFAGYSTQDLRKIRCDGIVKARSAGCICGAEHDVKCHFAEKFSKIRLRCRNKTPVEMFHCGHQNQVICDDWEKARKKPTLCKHVCEALLECGHKCMDICGRCARRAIDKGVNPCTDTPSREWYDHDTCKSQCGQILFCGHKCMEPCHFKQRPCGKCTKPCDITCSHRPQGSGRKCVDLFVPCMEQCDWKCPHRGRCQLPCSAPCDRLPCDKRCEKLLSCGCQCPSLCGEKCPTVKYCLLHGTSEVKNMRVDVRRDRTYGDISDEELTEDPLIVLPCGHAFLTSSLDDYMEIDHFYAKDEENRWLEARLHQRFGCFDIRKCCNICQEPIVNIRRYGRIINKTTLDISERAFFIEFETQIQDLNGKICNFSPLIDYYEMYDTNITTADQTQIVETENIRKDYTHLIKMLQSFTVAISSTKTQTESVKGSEADCSVVEKALQNFDLVKMFRLHHARLRCAYNGFATCMKRWLSLQAQLLTKWIYVQTLSSNVHGVIQVLKSGQTMIQEATEAAAHSLSKGILSYDAHNVVSICDMAMGVCTNSLNFTSFLDNRLHSIMDQSAAGLARANMKVFRDQVLQTTRTLVDKVQAVGKDSISKKESKRLNRVMLSLEKTSDKNVCIYE